MLKFGINMGAYPNVDDAEYIKAIADKGFSATFSGVFSDERQFEIANTCAKNGIIYETLHAPFKHINDIWFEGEDGNTMLNELLDCVDKCDIAGVKIAVVHLSSGENAPPLTEVGMNRFKKLVEYAKNKNVKIAFENQRKRYNLNWALETFSQDDGVGFCWDCGHETCFTPGQRFMPYFGNRILCTHIHDNSCEYNHDDHWLPFDGAVDFNYVAEELKKVKFDKSLMLEVFAKEQVAYFTLEKYLSRAYNTVKKLSEI